MCHLRKLFTWKIISREIFYQFQPTVVLAAPSMNAGYLFKKTVNITITFVSLNFDAFLFIAEYGILRKKPSHFKHWKWFPICILDEIQKKDSLVLEIAKIFILFNGHIYGHLKFYFNNKTFNVRECQLLFGQLLFSDCFLEDLPLSGVPTCERHCDFANRWWEKSQGKLNRKTFITIHTFITKYLYAFSTWSMEPSSSDLFSA